MFVESKFSRSLIAAIGALLMSSVTVGAAVGPAHAVGSSVDAGFYA